MLQAKKINLMFGNKTIFNNLSFNLNKNQKIGLVGRNGCGKSTLLSVIAKHQELDSGQINSQKNIKIAYLPQEVILISKKTILHEALTTFGSLIDFKNEYDNLKNIFEKEDYNQVEIDKLERFSFLQQNLDDADFDRKIIETKQILQNLGFKKNQFEKSTETLSVGWKMRLVLAKLLLQKADFYLLDEPTNHLDIIAKDWFLSFLKNAKFGFLFVSHDRYFLDHACDYIFELDRGNHKIYRGNYASYLQQKEKDLELQESAYLQQQKIFKKKLETIERFKAKASKAKMAQSMLRSLEKIKKIENVSQNKKIIKLNFPLSVRSGKIVLKIANFSKKFAENLIFQNVSFELFRGEKAAIIAANGVGKTTLLNLITKKMQKDTGTLEIGYNVKYAIFEQDQLQSLNQKNTILQETETVCKTTEQRQRLRNILGTFLFSGDDVDKKISVLSGGEKNRVAMVKVLLQNANFLILDEPTNHLDIQSRQILLQALQSYPGTILFVSHDRQFIDGLATKIFELTSNGIFEYSGNYEDFLYQKKQFENSFEEIDKKEKYDLIQKDKKKTGKQKYEHRKKIRSLEQKIDKLEKEQKELNQKFESIEYEKEKFDSLNKKIIENRKKLDLLLEEWEKLQ